MNIEGKNVVITGAAGGLGSGVTKVFVEAGADVAAVYHTKEDFEKLKDELGNPQNLSGFQADLTSETDVLDLLKKTADKFGRIDALVNLAGGFTGGNKTVDTPVEELEKMIAINLRTAFIACKIFLGQFINQKSGRIVNVGARPALKGTSGVSAYSASKAALLNLTQTMADETLEHNVNVNIVLPSVIATPNNVKAMPKANHEDWVSPESIGKVIAFLVSDDSKDISGAAIPVYGNA